MANRKSTVDGFIPRSTTSRLGDFHHGPVQKAIGEQKELHSSGIERRSLSAQKTDKSLKRSEINESLREIDNTSDDKEKMSRRKRRKLARQGGGKKSKTRRIIKRIVIIFLIILVGVGGYVGIRALRASGNILQGSILDIVQSQPLKEDKNGRSNFLVFGTEPGGHPGGNLTDTIMVLSISQVKKDAFMISIPRDLWVDYGQACSSGYEGKINALYDCFSDGGTDEDAGVSALKEKVSMITGLELQYSAHVSWAAVVDLVNAVGGIDVVIESDDPRGILDRNFDYVCNYTCYYVNYKNGETAHLDGERALALARARNASGGYGLPNGNFDREKNQQKIIKALRKKAVSAGTLTNLGKVTGLIDALGDNLRTNIETKEIRTLMDVAAKMDDSAIRSLSLVEEGNMLVTTGNMGGQSIVRPVAGVYDYSAIQAYIKKNASSDAVVREAAEIVILNGTDQTGIAQKEADTLEAKGYTITAVDNAPEGTYSAVEVYKLSDSYSATATKLKKLYGLKEFTAGTPPLEVDSSTAFVIVIGSAQQ